jgi:hypothetical protein
MEPGLRREFYHPAFVKVKFDGLVKSQNLDGFVKCARSRHENVDPLAGSRSLANKIPRKDG